MKLWQEILLILICTCLAGAVSHKINPIELGPEDPLAITAREFKKLNYQNLILLDVRSASHYEKGHINQAIHFEPSQWEESFASLMANFTGEEKIYIYCDTGCGSSKTVTKQLKEAGLEDVFYIHNGWTALQSEAMKTETRDE